MIAAIDFDRPAATPQQPIEEDPSYPVVKTVIEAASSRKAKNIVACRVTHLTEVTEFMVICEGNSRPQNQAIADTVEDNVQEEHMEGPSKQGNSAGGWILLDYGSVIVHVMTPQMRNFYKLEKRWKSAELVDIESILGSEDDSIGSAQEEEEEREEEDPFWS
jgi:ribosome-associated protein